MKTEKIINKETKEVYKSENGTEFTKNTFELGDTFIPKHNSIIEKIKKGVTTKKGVMNITEYRVLAFVKNKDDVEQEVNDSNEIYIDLTPSQAISLKKKLNDDVLINQNQFVVREYESEEWGTQLGVYLKGHSIPAKTWDDFKTDDNTNEVKKSE